MFEINIRALGGLLSAYSLSGNPVFLDTAKRVGDALLPSFKTESGIPNAAVDVGTGDSGKHSWQGKRKANIILAEPTTLQVEFRYLSHATGDPVYQQAADKAMDVIAKVVGQRGIVPIYLAPGNPPAFQGKKISLGAMGDSYYEYLLKQWIQTGKKEDRFKDMWKRAMADMISHLVMKTKGGRTFIAEQNNEKQVARMDHLTCFVGGMLMLGSNTLPRGEVNPYWVQLAADVGETCYEMYRRTPTGLSPEYTLFRTENGAGADMAVPQDAPHNLLRPEAIETLYYLHYYTGDPKYRRWAYEMFSAFQKHCKVRFGYSAIGDVRKQPPTPKDSQESFWLAETLKYFYLIFAPRNTLSLEEFVLNTEAQPMRVWS
jgi:mannosyl-oligosaccharide alpha-1,2-mannosidase